MKTIVRRLFVENIQELFEVILMMLENAIAEVLKEERKKKNLSQEDLALLCSLDRTYISLIERAKRKPTIHTIYVICDHLGITLTYFISRVEELL